MQGLEPRAQESFDVFISYAHADDADGHVSEFVALLREVRDTQQYRSWQIFFDLKAIEPGDDWQQRLTRVTAAGAMIVLLSPSYFRSEWCRKEWQGFREQEQKPPCLDRVFPVYLQTDDTLDDSAQDDDWHKDLARRQHIDLREVWTVQGTKEQARKTLERLERLISDRLKDHAHQRQMRRLGIPYQSIPLPPYFVPRPDDLSRVRQALLSTEGGPGLVMSAVFGMGGIGKTTLAADLVRQADVRDYFEDGILWATLGQNPEVRSLLSQWIIALGDHSFRSSDAGDYQAHLRSLLQSRKMLLVIDDAWSSDHVNWFRVGGDRCRVLVTTRDQGIARAIHATSFDLDVMTPEQSLALITGRLGRPLRGDEQDHAARLAEDVGRLPLALGLIASQAADGIPWGQLREDLRRYYNDDHPETADGVKPLPSFVTYFDRTLRESRPLNEAKIILVGRGEVGKTSLVNRLVHNTFNPEENKTEGIRITKWLIRLRSDALTLHIWDFGGQEIMHATHQFFLTERSLYLLVLNGRHGQEDGEVEYWLRLIKGFGGDSPVIVVLNKVSHHLFDLNRRALQQKYPNIKGFVLTDCKDLCGIDDLRKAITEEVDHLPLLREKFPAQWFRIKERLASMRDNYLTFESYRKLCRDLGEPDPKAQEDLARFLHSLGVALNYRDDPRLSDKHVLNPHWVTEGLYTVLNAKRLEEHKGQLSVADLARLLPSKDYPREMHGFLLELMRKFELCFPIPDDPSLYLVPELLGKDQPIEAERLHPEDCLNFEYRYSVLPEGLLPCFIVRTHSLSEGRQRWRTGVILEFDDNQALVKAALQDTPPRIIVNVTGAPDRRQNLLALIRSEFERIHARFPNLGVEEFVPLPWDPAVAIPWRKLRVLEENGVSKLMDVVGEEVIELDVQELLTGVDVAAPRRKDRGAGQSPAAVLVFFSYFHRDELHLGQLKGHVRLLERQGLIEPWDDRQVRPGDEWAGEIDENLNRADLILFLVSHHFINSDYCYKIERARALERALAHEATVIPVILDDVDLQGEEFMSLQVLPTDAKPILSAQQWPNPNAAWRNVAEGIRKVVMELRKKKDHPR